MKASELRIGNWIHNNMDGKDFQVAADTLIWLARGKEMLMTNPPKPIVEPIPLTEEWLLKFGFVNYFDSGRLKYFKTAIKNSLTGEDHELQLWQGHPVWVFAIQCDSESDEYRFCQHIRYVHQLQNLYFALTGEELTIKE